MMLQQKQTYSSFRGIYGFMHTTQQGMEDSSVYRIHQHEQETAFRLWAAPAEDETEPDEADGPLDDAVKSEREYVRGRLREELKREPTEEELDEWLRQHTEGY
jgi:hypothetical protein